MALPGRPQCGISINFKRSRAAFGNGTRLAYINRERSKEMKTKTNVKAGTAVEYAVMLALIIVVCITY